METKEGIEFINDLEIYIHDDYPEFREYKEAFIELLQQGESYKKMWEELSDWHNKSGIGNLTEAIETLKQKHFPKEVKNGSKPS